LLVLYVWEISLWVLGEIPDSLNLISGLAYDANRCAKAIYCVTAARLTAYFTG